MVYFLTKFGALNIMTPPPIAFHWKSPVGWTPKMIEHLFCTNKLEVQRKRIYFCRDKLARDGAMRGAMAALYPGGSVSWLWWHWMIEIGADEANGGGFGSEGAGEEGYSSMVLGIGDWGRAVFLGSRAFPLCPERVGGGWNYRGGPGARMYG